MRLLRRRTAQGTPPPVPVVTVDDVGIRRTAGHAVIEAVDWDELTGVDIVTTADGPFAEDVFFVLIGDEARGCVVPHSAVSSELLGRLQDLDGFDDQAVIAAMGSAEEARFVCWRAPGSA